MLEITCLYSLNIIRETSLAVPVRIEDLNGLRILEANCCLSTCKGGVTQ